MVSVNLMHILPPSSLDCSADQTSGCGMVPPPSCDNPNPTQTDGVGCFCPDGMLIKADNSCVLPNTCIGEVKHIKLCVIIACSKCTAIVQSCSIDIITRGR